jgi:hypothetical protein
VHFGQKPKTIRFLSWNGGNASIIKDIDSWQSIAPTASSISTILFENHCQFVSSHEHFEIRIADGIGTIFSRFLNDGRCKRAYDLLRPCICANGHVPEYLLNDFDLSAWRYEPSKNPYLSESRTADSQGNGDSAPVKPPEVAD